MHQTEQQIDVVLPERYRPEGELGRGGMGVVWRVTDLQFERPLAVKVMLPKTAVHAEDIARFEREATLTGSLQHPAIPPVVDRGTLSDGMPYFSLKLIEGETLRNLLKQRTNPQDDLPRFLGIFEQVCQAVGYAHSRGIVHRDLKPANIMVGEFGEVQVMDWGMAKQVHQKETWSGRVFDRREAAGLTIDVDSDTVLFDEPGSNANSAETVEHGQSITLTRAGQVLGTLAYMPPEQARGEQEQLDARADVFALGGILCKILTGRELYTGRDLNQLYQKVVAADHGEALTRLEESPADAELIQLCRQCLSPEPSNRPANAAQVAESIRRYEETTRERLEREKAERVAADTRAAEEEKRRRVTLMAASLGLLLLIGAGATAWWYQQTRSAARNAQQIRDQQGRTDVEVALSQLPALWEEYQFPAAAALLERAETRLKQMEHVGDLRQQLDAAQRDHQFLEEIEHILLKKTARGREMGFNYTYGNGEDGLYAQAFRRFGLDVLTADPRQLAEQIQACSLHDDVLTGLEYWALDETFDIRDRITQVVALVDPHSSRARARDETVFSDEAKRNQLLADLAADRAKPELYAVLSKHLYSGGNLQEAVRVLRQGVSYHPDDFLLHCLLAGFAGQIDSHSEEMIAHQRAALAIRPNSAIVQSSLGNAFLSLDRLEQAEVYFLEAVRLNPDFAEAHENLGIVYKRQLRNDEAEAAFKRSQELNPDNRLVYYNLAVLFDQDQRPGEAEKMARKALEIDKDFAAAWGMLGLLLNRRQQYDEAEQALKRNLELSPHDQYALLYLGATLIDNEKPAEAETHLRMLLELDPQSINTYLYLGISLYEQKRYVESLEVMEQGKKLSADDKNWQTTFTNHIQDCRERLEKSKPSPP